MYSCVCVFVYLASSLSSKTAEAGVREVGVYNAIYHSDSSTRKRRKGVLVFKHPAEHCSDFHSASFASQDMNLS